MTEDLKTTAARIRTMLRSRGQEKSKKSVYSVRCFEGEIEVRWKDGLSISRVADIIFRATSLTHPPILLIHDGIMFSFFDIKRWYVDLCLEKTEQADIEYVDAVLTGAGTTKTETISGADGDYAVTLTTRTLGA
jgi:hypothetical protein